MVDLYGLIGRGITHSFSSEYFNDKFRREGIAADYRNFDIDDISRLIHIVKSYPRLSGLNVTSPYKREVIPFLDSLSPEAESLNAVNVIRIHRTGDSFKLYGFNTDSPGFGMTLPALLSKDVTNLQSKKTRPFQALILGTGGAASAVGLALTKISIPYKTVSRGKNGDLRYCDLPSLISDYRLIINATPVGMYPHTEEAPDIPYDLLRPDHICYDLIYNPSQTLFLKKAAAMGAATANGLQMLLNQAELAWQIWKE